MSTRKTERRGATAASYAAVRDAEVDAVLRACRVLVALSARSILAVEDVADVVQVRILVVVAAAGSASLGAVAEAAGLHVSRASRLCDRMVGAGLLHRANDPSDRRLLTLTLTQAGREVVESVMDRRREEVSRALARMSRPRRAELVRALDEFAAAGASVTEADLMLLGWS
jgi:DNA-binding MarR family transcriptional regulator